MVRLLGLLVARLGDGSHRGHHILSLMVVVVVQRLAAARGVSSLMVAAASSHHCSRRLQRSMMMVLLRYVSLLGRFRRRLLIATPCRSLLVFGSARIEGARGVVSPMPALILNRGMNLGCTGRPETCKVGS